MRIYIQDEVVELPNASNAIELAKRNPAALAVKINGELKDLSTPLHEGDVLEWIDFSSKEGKEIFWHTTSHVLAQAIVRLYPNAKRTIGPAIEQGFYFDFADLAISDKDLEKIEEEMRKIIKENHSLEKLALSEKEIKELYKDNPYKLELLEKIEPPYSAYRQGEYIDLCLGPHLSNVGKIKAFKLLKLAGAYWKGDSKNAMLTRIYGISFPEKKLLEEHLTMLEEAKKRDHKILGKELNLFSVKEEAPGMPFLHPQGMIIWEKLLTFLRGILKDNDYSEIKTPVLLNQSLWVRSGHMGYYKDSMYYFTLDDEELALKPMNCPGCILYYKSHTHSYRELPLRLSEIGHVHRREASGALNGLFRVRSFHQDDAHIFLETSQTTKEILTLLVLIQKVYSTFGLPFHLELSTRPEKTKTIGTDAEWDRATADLKDALKEWGQPYRINEGEGAFYGPKIDVHIKDAIGRTWQCGTIQLDFNLPERFDLEYVSQTGERKRPAMIHRVFFGSIERFFGILIEHFAGKFPFWLSPRPIRIIPVSEKHLDYAREIAKTILSEDFLCEVDETNESVNKKIRNAQILKINYMLTVGDKEIERHTVSLRTRDNVVHGELSLSSFLEAVTKEKKERSLISPFSIKGQV